MTLCHRNLTKKQQHDLSNEIYRQHIQRLSDKTQLQRPSKNWQINRTGLTNVGPDRKNLWGPYPRDQNERPNDHVLC